MSSKFNNAGTTAVIIQRRKSLSTNLTAYASPQPTASQTTTTPPTTSRKLHKPPHNALSTQQHPQPDPQNRPRAGLPPRNRLKKRAQTFPLTLPSQQQHPHHPNPRKSNQQPISYFLLSHAPYPSSSAPAQYLGVYSSIDTITAAAFRHGAYTFSREGLLDGSEYLSATGKIRIEGGRGVVKEGVGVDVLETHRVGNGEVRLDIPHPAAAPSPENSAIVLHSCGGAGVVGDAAEQKETLYLAIHEGPRSAFCIGLYARKDLAWAACLKDKAWLAWSDALVDEETGFAEGNAPWIEAKVVGSARVRWFVKACEVDWQGRVDLRGGGVALRDARNLLLEEDREREDEMQVALFDTGREERRVEDALPVGCRDV